jgi:hypothetical protein
VNALAYDTRLECAAKKQCGFMASSGEFDHDTPGNPKLATRVSDCQFGFSSAAENLYMDNYGGKTDACQTALENSPGHLANILSANNDRVGLAICQGNGGNNYWVQVFGKEMVRTGDQYLVYPDQFQEASKDVSQVKAEEIDQEPVESVDDAPLAETPLADTEAIKVKTESSYNEKPKPRKRCRAKLD